MKILAERLVLEILKDEMLPTDLPSDIQQIRKVYVMEQTHVMKQQISTVYVMEIPTANGITYKLIDSDKFNQMRYAMESII